MIIEEEFIGCMLSLKNGLHKYTYMENGKGYYYRRINQIHSYSSFILNLMHLHLSACYLFSDSDLFII